MGALLFIAVFLASFLVGSGTGYLLQNQSGAIGSPVPTPESVDSANFCLPERGIIERRYQITPTDQALKIEAFGNPEDQFFSEIKDGLTPEMIKVRNWTKVLRWTFGGEIQIPELSNTEIDRRTKTWTLVKRDAPIPAWKIADFSGGIIWNIPKCLWDSTIACALGEINTDPSNFGPAPGNQVSTPVAFLETTWMGYLDINRISNDFLRERYTLLKAQTIGEEANAIGDIWVPTGWCGINNVGIDLTGVNRENNPDGNPLVAQQVCADPLVRDVLLVVTKKGRGARQGRSSIPMPRDILDPSALTSEDDWWFFDVYYNFGNQPISFDSLPDWMKSCGQGNNPYNPSNRVRRSAAIFKDLFKKTLSKINKVIDKYFTKTKTTEAANYPEFISGQAIEFDAAFNNEQQRSEIRNNTYVIVSSSPRSSLSLVGRVNFFDDQQATIYIGDNTNNIYLDTESGFYKYTIIHSAGTRQETLKLGTFKPPKIFKPFTYEWYTPACKPAIYLYPEKETTLSVYLNPDGRLTKTDPLYQNGWQNLRVKPTGKIYLGQKQYPYLYYEAEIKNVNIPQEGWVVEKDKLPSFFNAILPLLGLKDNEIKDFKNYWLKKLSDKPYYFVGLLDNHYLNQIENIQFSQKPSQFIRIRFFFEGLDQLIEIPPKLLPAPPKREGFVAVDWGGMLASGSCDEGISSYQLSE